MTVDRLLTDGTIYVVPLFQRSYSWKEEQITELWSDLMDTCRLPGREHFTGMMVFCPDPRGKGMLILDGQQRFATFILLMAALRDVLGTTSIDGKDDWIKEIDRRIYTRDLVTRQTNIKIELNREDKSYFERVAIKGDTTHPSRNSHKLIAKCYLFMKEKIEEEVKKHGSVFVEGILSTIRDKVMLIRIEVDNDVTAHIIFEALNDRGLALSVADLLKNYILSISGRRIEDVGQMWQDIVDQVGDYNVVRFLRHYYNSKYRLVRKEDLYKELKSLYDERNVESSLETLRRETEAYSNLSNPTSEFWRDNEILERLDDLRFLRVEQVYILLLGCWARLGVSNIGEFRRVLNSIVNFTFRYNTVCGLNPNMLEVIYSELSTKFRRGEINVDDILSRLRKASPDKDIFINSFKEMETKSSALAKYILVKINDKLLSEEGKKEIQAKVRKINLEHIIPKRPSSEWISYLDSKSLDYRTLVYRLGNMTVMLSRMNQAIQNKSFEKKREYYVKSQLPLNFELGSFQEFGLDEINKRQLTMAAIAENIWNL